MKIKVDFTMDVSRHHLERLRSLAEADTNQEAVLFVKGEAQEMTRIYLEDNGVQVRIVRDSATTY